MKILILAVLVCLFAVVMYHFTPMEKFVSVVALVITLLLFFRDEIKTYLLIKLFEKIIIKRPGSYEINYMIGSRWFSIYIPRNELLWAPNSSIMSVITITKDGEPIDITDQVMMAAGPNNDFYDRPFTPYLMGLPGMVIELMSGEKINVGLMQDIRELIQNN